MLKSLIKIQESELDRSQNLLITCFKKAAIDSNVLKVPKSTFLPFSVSLYIEAVPPPFLFCMRKRRYSLVDRPPAVWQGHLCPAKSQWEKGSQDLFVSDLTLNSAILISDLFIDEMDFLFTWSVIRLFMFGPFVALTAVWYWAEIMGLMRALWVGEVSRRIRERVSDSQWRRAVVIAWKMFAESAWVPWTLITCERLYLACKKCY